MRLDRGACRGGRARPRCPCRRFGLGPDIPDDILEMVKIARQDPEALAEVKRQQFSYFDLAGQLGNVRRRHCHVDGLLGTLLS
jgi:hypothetical protein